LAVLHELAALSQTNYVAPFEIAHVQAGLGKVDASLDSLERAATERSGWVVYCGVWPAFESLRSNKRFQALLNSMALRRSGDGSTKPYDEWPPARAISLNAESGWGFR